MREFYQNHSVLSAVGLTMLQALAMTIRVNIAELECLGGSVRRLLRNMSNHTHDVDFTQTASRWIPGRFGSESAQHRHTLKGQAADCFRDFFETFGELRHEAWWR